MRPNILTYIDLGSLEPLIEDIPIPKSHIRRKREKITQELYDSELCETVSNPAEGTYTVVAGFTTYMIYKEKYKDNQLVPCKQYTQMPPKERYKRTLEWLFNNRIIDWYIRHRVIHQLLHYHYTVQDLSKFLGRGPRVINYYIGPPPQYLRKAQSVNKVQLISKLWQVPFKHVHNNKYLIEKVLDYEEHITENQLTFISWLRGQLQFEEQGLTIEQEQYLINQALQLRESFLDEMWQIINEMK